MVEGRQLIEWDHTAAICATVVNMLRDPKSKAINAAEINPYRKKSNNDNKKIKLNKKDSMKLLKAVFIDHKLPDDIGGIFV